MHDKHNWMGSKSRDIFKYLHKYLTNDNFAALDCDFELIEYYSPTGDTSYRSKDRIPFIVARLDFKVGGGEVEWTEIAAYNQLIYTAFPWKVPVYIVHATSFLVKSNDPDLHLENDRFTIYTYDPCVVPHYCWGRNMTWSDLDKWEGNLRYSRAREIAPYYDLLWQAQHPCP